MMRCIYCQAEITEQDALYCTNCGRKLPEKKKCDHCGAGIDDDDRFCPNCGKEVDSPEEISENQEVNSSKRWMVAGGILAALLLLGGGIFYWQKQSIPLGEEVSITENEESSAKGLLALAEAQKKNGTDGWEVKVTIDPEDDDQTIRIYKDGNLFQEFEKNWYASNFEKDKIEQIIHLVDYNFDGHLDILFGVAEDRTANTLFLWSQEEGKFKLYGEIGYASCQSPLIDNASKAIYTKGSGGANEAWYDMSKWVDGELKSMESLKYIGDIEEWNQWNEEKVKYHYTLKDADGKVIAGGNAVSDLPEKWQEVLSEYEKISEQQRIEEEKLAKDNQAKLEERIKQQLYEMINERYSGLVESPQSITRLEQGNNGLYKAEFTNHGEYENYDYIIYDIQLDGNGDVAGFGVDTEHIRPTEKKSEPIMTQKEYYEMKMREASQY